jgi:hypothetical protein
MSMRAIFEIMALSLVIAGSGALAVDVQEPDWNAVSDTKTVEVVTEDEDGSLRTTTVWLFVQDGEAFIRTGDTRWGRNIVRNGELTLRVGEHEYPLGVVFQEDDMRRERIKQGFRDKYGWSDGLISWIRDSHPKHMRLVSR